MDTRDEHYEKWSEFAPLGLVLVGLGLAVTLQAAQARANKRGFLRWFIGGTLGLVIFNSGLAYFGEAVKERALYEAKRYHLLGGES